MVRHARRGFTLIELLVVIGIILLLTAIGVIGFIHIDKVGSEKSTQTRLALCQSMQAEYEVENQLQFIEGGGLTANPPNPPTFYISVLPPYSALPGSQGTNPGDVTSGSQARYLTTGMVYTTGQIIQTFARMPKVKTDLSQVSPAALLQGPPPNGGTWVDLNNNNQPLYVLLDAWRNPIIYVPSTGLPGVTFGKRPIPPAMPTYYVVQSLDGRPFWASAGQDGDFSTGDDNLYSVPVKAQ